MTSIERARVLQGHTDQQTAFLVDDYPYSFSLRCKIRYWIETAAKGAKKGQQRFMSQTTDARRGNSTWNRPKGSTYALMAVMYLDSDDHVQWTGISEYGVTPVADARWRYRGILEQLTDAQRAEYDRMLTFFRRRDERSWQEWETRVAAITAHLAATGAEPVLDNGMFNTPTGGRLYLPNDDLPVYLAAARERLATS